MKLIAGAAMAVAGLVLAALAPRLVRTPGDPEKAASRLRAAAVIVFCVGSFMFWASDDAIFVRVSSGTRPAWSEPVTLLVSGLMLMIWPEPIARFQAMLVPQHKAASVRRQHIIAGRIVGFLFTVYGCVELARLLMAGN